MGETPRPDLAIRKTAPEFAAPGAPITYTLSVENVGTTATSRLTVIDPLPDGASFVSSDGLYRPGPPVYTEWAMDGLEPRQVAVFQLVVTATTTLVNAGYRAVLEDGWTWSGDPAVTIVSSQISTGTVDVSAGGIVTSSTGKVDLHFPPGAAAEPVTVTVVQAERLLSDSGFAGIAFGVEAVDEGGNSVTRFEEPLTLRVRYEEHDWQNAGIRDESQLNLYVYSEGVWQAVLPCAGCSHDLENNVFTAVLDHLSLFAIRRKAETSYLPVLRR